jgi:hypothetical protein
MTTPLWTAADELTRIPVRSREQLDDESTVTDQKSRMI